MEADRAVPRRLAAADAAACAALHRRLFTPAWDETAFRILLSAPETEAQGIEHGSAGLVTFLVARVAADEAEIVTFGVAPAQQRQGLASRLLATVIACLRRRGVRCAYLEVAEDNAAARALYSRAGFAQVGRRRDYYVASGSPSRDAIVLRLEL